MKTTAVEGRRAKLSYHIFYGKLARAGIQCSHVKARGVPLGRGFKSPETKKERSWKKIFRKVREPIAAGARNYALRYGGNRSGQRLSFH